MIYTILWTEENWEEEMGIIKGHWTTSASPPIFFQKSWDFYTIRSVYLYVVTACLILLATST